MTKKRLAALILGFVGNGFLLTGCGHGAAAQASPGPSPVQTATGAGSALLEGCAREQPDADNSVWKCGARVVNFSTVVGVTPDAFMDQVIEGISKALATKIQQTPIRLEVSGKEVEARQLSATSADGKSMMTSYLIARTAADGKCQLVHCLAVKSDPQALEACKPTIDYLLTNGPPPAPPSAPRTVDLQELFGRSVSLDPDCQLTPGEHEGGGQVRCADRLTIRWDSVPPAVGAPELDVLGNGLASQFTGSGSKVQRDAPKCQIRGVDGVCVRLNVTQPKGQYSFLLGTYPPKGREGNRLVLCGSRDDNPVATGLCRELFSFK